MDRTRRHPTKYPGVFYRLAERIGGAGDERVYYCRFKKDGRPWEEKVGRQYADQMTEARASRYRADLIEGRRKLKKESRAEQQKKRWTLNELWAAYCEQNARNKAIVKETRAWNCHIAEGIGKREPKTLVPLDIDRLRITLEREGKRTQAARLLELLRRAINFGASRNLIEPLHFRFTLPKLNNAKTEILTDEQLARLLQALEADPDQQAADLMKLALFTGMRRGELLKLQWPDIDFERGFIQVRDPKGGRDETIPLNRQARMVLEAHPLDPDNAHVFPGRFSGRHASDMRVSIDRIRKAAGLPDGFRPLHGLRHVYASMLASSGKVDMYTLQRLLTHKSPLMTQRYAHLRDDALRRASELAGEIVSNLRIFGGEDAEKKRLG